MGRFDFFNNNSRSLNKKFFMTDNIDEIEVSDIEELVPVEDIGATEVGNETTIEENTTSEMFGRFRFSDDIDVSDIPGAEPNHVEYDTPFGGEDNGEVAVKESLIPYLRNEFIKKDLITLFRVKQVIEKHGMTKALHALVNSDGKLSKAFGFDGQILTAEKFNIGLTQLCKKIKNQRVFK